MHLRISCYFHSVSISPFSICFLRHQAVRLIIGCRCINRLPRASEEWGECERELVERKEKEKGKAGPLLESQAMPGPGLVWSPQSPVPLLAASECSFVCLHLSACVFCQSLPFLYSSISSSIFIVLPISRKRHLVSGFLPNSPISMQFASFPYTSFRNPLVFIQSFCFYPLLI